MHARSWSSRPRTITFMDPWLCLIRLARLVLGGTVALGVIGPVVGVDDALAAQSSVTVVGSKVDPGPTDPETGVAPWLSGALTIVATRMPDGRIRARVRATILSRRRFTAQITIDPCNAVLAAPSMNPSAPVLDFVGRGISRRQPIHKGRNQLQLSGTVTSNPAGALQLRNWTDCVSADVLDDQETEPALFEQFTRIGERQGSCAFCSTVAVLSTTAEDGQHV
jgi:hypothetical protein